MKSLKLLLNWSLVALLLGIAVFLFHSTAFIQSENQDGYHSSFNVPLTYASEDHRPAGTEISEGSNQEQKKGQEHFSSMCAKCHDDDAEGDGPLHSVHSPPPANLTLIRNTEKMTFSIVTTGIRGSGMPWFPISEKDFHDLHNHIKSQPFDTTREWDHPWNIDKSGDVDSQYAAQMYRTACQGCHGEKGKGDGAWGDDDRVWPKPANFRARNSNIGRVFYIINNGRPGTMMAAQKNSFPEKTRWALAQFVSSMFDENADYQIRTPQQSHAALKNRYTSKEKKAVDSGDQTFQLYCVACHNAGAKGSFLAPRMTDTHWLYGGGTDQAVFTIIEKGIPGKLMPGHHQLDGDLRWKIIAYLRHRGGIPEPVLSPISSHGAHSSLSTTWEKLKSVFGFGAGSSKHN